MSNISYILLFSFLFYFCSCSTYTLVVDKKSEYCIGEYLSEGTVGKYN
ncbi:MAG: hypothetical protein MJ252_11765 [archaeon]|nr:hypothetical protein [archaeon]